jgi:hypothetical protein
MILGALLVLSIDVALPAAAHATSFEVLVAERVLLRSPTDVEDLLVMARPLMRDEDLPVLIGRSARFASLGRLELRAPADLPWSSALDGGVLTNPGGVVLARLGDVRSPPIVLGSFLDFGGPSFLIEPLAPPEGRSISPMAVVVVLAVFGAITVGIRWRVKQLSRRCEMSSRGPRGERVVVVYKRRSSRRSQSHRAAQETAARDAETASMSEPGDARS